jgi:hypothetical protein
VPHEEVEVLHVGVPKVTYALIVGVHATLMLDVKRNVACVVTQGTRLSLVG